MTEEMPALERATRAAQVLVDALAEQFPQIDIHGQLSTGAMQVLINHEGIELSSRVISMTTEVPDTIPAEWGQS